MRWPFKKHDSKPKTAAVIVAAGSSNRMGFDKVFAELDGSPVLFHSIWAFENCDKVDEIIIVLREEMMADSFNLSKTYGFNKIHSIVKGGNTRQQSVFLGVQACSEDVEYICIHDGARPLVSQEVINSAIDAAFIHSAATAAVPVKDTIKQSKDGFISATVPRDDLMIIQTPQVFKKEVYLAAYSDARCEYSDDCQLLEAIGAAVAFSDGDYKNIKLTTPDDLVFAEMLFAEKR